MIVSLPCSKLSCGFPVAFQDPDPQSQALRRWPFLQLYFVLLLFLCSLIPVFFRGELAFLLSQQSLSEVFLAIPALLADSPSLMRPQLMQFLGGDQVRLFLSYAFLMF